MFVYKLYILYISLYATLCTSHSIHNFGIHSCSHRQYQSVQVVSPRLLAEITQAASESLYPADEYDTEEYDSGIIYDSYTYTYTL